MSIATNQDSTAMYPVDVASSATATLPIDLQGNTLYWWCKELADRAAALALLIPALPIMALLALIVRVNSRGPGIFRQVRVGRDGQEFTMYKIRTMRCDAESAAGAQWCSGTSDPRVTRIGKLIRKLHLDEFPQLFNVLRGEMSLIGPRPERPEFVEVLDRAIPGYALRHQVKPGITGLAQINLPPDTDLDSVRKKLMLDLEYIEKASFLLDARMFMCTALRLIGLRGELAMRLLKLYRTVKLPEVRQNAAETMSPRQMTPEMVAVLAQYAPNRAAHREAAAQELVDAHSGPRNKIKPR
jgi:lipopolysaccharide/colanic/teichoic acid biosynthesis glycosyltransferase